jgi:hypothetical protein
MLGCGFAICISELVREQIVVRTCLPERVVHSSCRVVWSQRNNLSVSARPEERWKSGRQCANSTRADSTALRCNAEESSGRTVSTISHNATGSWSSGRAMVREAGLRVRGALCRQPNSTHSQFHPNHRSTRRCAVDRPKHKTPQTIYSSSSS